MSIWSSEKWRLYVALVAGLLLSAAASARGLHDLFPFRLDVAVSNAQIADAPDRELALIARHFNSVTPENALKPQPLQPGQLAQRLPRARAHGLSAPLRPRTQAQALGDAPLAQPAELRLVPRGFAPART
ncbi:MAG: endo-1,4-beta-xylanase [Kiritimatiellae bacterium]|nr:endo-1,4-beta-xylanase [Kiritimatiellia bacterium]MBQ8126762.1 endo-1,4-beta-xylanase [Kiritimatiellia bacterium]